MSKRPLSGAKILVLLSLLLHVFALSCWLGSDLTPDPDEARLGLAILFSLLLLIPFGTLFGRGASPRFDWRASRLLAVATVGLDLMLLTYSLSTSDLVKYYDLYRWMAVVSMGLGSVLMLCFFMGPEKLFNHTEAAPSALASAGVALGLFICVTYYVGFSLALYDRWAIGNKKDRIFYSPKYLYSAEGAAGAVGAGDVPVVLGALEEFGHCYLDGSQQMMAYRGSALSPSPSSGSDPYLDSHAAGMDVFWLREGEDAPILNARLRKDLLDGTFAFSKEHPAIIEMQEGERRWELEAVNDIEERRLGLLNACSLRQILARIRSIEEHQKISIRVESFVTIKRVKSRDLYPSDATLAQLRAEIGVDVIDSMIPSFVRSGEMEHWPDIEWKPAFDLRTPRQTRLCNIMAHSYLRETMEEICNANVGGWSLLVPVAVTIQELPGRQAEMDGSKDLSLLDYMYFAIYTITTTGYGDITPVKPFSRVIVSFANLFEVFFVVVFFNLLIDQRRRQAGD